MKPIPDQQAAQSPWAWSVAARQAMQDAVGLAHREHFRKTYLVPALELGVIEMTHPDKPNSRSQRYRLTALGQRWLDAHSGSKCP